jgi:LacI family transcriptional regulator
MGEQNDAPAIISTDHLLISTAIEQLGAKGIPVVAYVSDLSAARRASFAGPDNWKLGRTAAWFIRHMATGPGKVFPLVGNNRYQCQDDRA